MLCCVVLCLCCVVLCYVTLRYVTLCYVMLCYQFLVDTYDPFTDILQDWFTGSASKMALTNKGKIGRCLTIKKQKKSSAYTAFWTYWNDFDYATVMSNINCMRTVTALCLYLFTQWRGLTFLSMGFKTIATLIILYRNILYTHGKWSLSNYGTATYLPIDV